MPLPLPTPTDPAAGTPDFSRAQSWALVNAKYADAGNWATYGATLMQGYFADIQGVLKTLSVTADFAAVKVALDGITLYTPPGTAFTYTPPTAPTYLTVPTYAAQTLGTILDIPAVATPSIGVAPSAAISDPAALADLVLATGSMPAFQEPSTLNYSAPTAPTYDVIPAYTAPVLGTLLAVPAVDAITIGAVPSTVITFTNDDFSDAALTALRTRLMADIATYSTGLGAAVETAMMARETARVSAVTVKAYNEATTFYSSKGFDMPPGGLGSKISEASSDAALRLTDSSGKILEETSRLALDYNKHVLTATTQMADLLSKVFDNKVVRAFEAEKIRVTLALEGFKETVAVALAKGQLNATAINATSSRNDATVKVFQAELEGQLSPIKAVVEINQVKTGAYGAAIQSAVADLNAQVIPAEFKLKQLDSNIKIAGLKAEVLGKAATIQLDAKKTAVTLAMEGFKQTVATELAKADLNKVAISSTVAANEATVKVFEAKIAGQIEPMKAVAGVNQAMSSAYGAAVQAETGNLNAKVIPEELKLKGVGMNAQIAESKANIVVKEAALAIETAFHELTLEVSTMEKLAAGAQQIVASALNGVSSGANFNWSGSASTSYTGT